MDIQKRIERSGLTDAQIAAELGTQPATVWRYRKGQRRPNETHLRRLSQLLGCTPADLRPDLAALFEVRDAG